MMKPTPRRTLSTLIDVKPSGVHGKGVFARTALPQGTPIGRYAGRRLARVDRPIEDPRYLFGLSDGSCIDGHRGGNETRWINHSCEPNCHAAEYRGRTGLIHVRISTLRALQPGEELFLNYQLAIDPREAPQNYPCRCGSAHCRKTLVAPA